MLTACHSDNGENGTTRAEGAVARSESQSKPPTPPPAAAAPAPAEDPLDVELRDLVTKASSANVTNSQAIPDLYSFLKRHPDKQARYESMLDEAVGPSSPYKLYIKRRLDALAMAETRGESRHRAERRAAVTDRRRRRSAASATPAAGTPQKENGGGAQSKEALSPMLDTDTRLEMLKNKFQFFAQARTNAQKEAE